MGRKAGMAGRGWQVLVNQLVTGVEMTIARPVPRSRRPTTLWPATSWRERPVISTAAALPDCLAAVRTRLMPGGTTENRIRRGVLHLFALYLELPARVCCYPPSEETARDA